MISMPEPLCFEFKYCLTEKDVESFLLFHARSPYNRFRLIMMGIAPLLLAVFAYLFTGNSIYFDSAIFICILLIISLPFSIIIVKWLIKKRIKKYPKQYLIGVDQTLVLNNESIVNQTQFKKISLSWNDIEYVLCDKNNVYLYQNSKNTIPVPRRLFASKAEFADCLQKIKEVHAESRKHAKEVK